MRSLEATITLEYVDQKTAEAVAKAVSPDNYAAPTSLKVETIRENNKVITQIFCDGKLATFTATIDDLLSSVTTAEKTVQAVTRIKL